MKFPRKYSETNYSKCTKKKKIEISPSGTNSNIDPKYFKNMKTVISNLDDLLQSLSGLSSELNDVRWARKNPVSKNSKEGGAWGRVL